MVFAIITSNDSDSVLKEFVAQKRLKLQQNGVSCDNSWNRDYYLGESTIFREC